MKAVDLYFFKESTPLARLIRLWSPESSHVAPVFDDRQAEFRINRVDWVHPQKPDEAYRLWFDVPEWIEAQLFIEEKINQKEYDTFGVLLFPFRSPIGKKNQKPFCSEIVDQMCSQFFWKLSPKASHQTTPQDLLFACRVACRFSNRMERI